MTRITTLAIIDKEMSVQDAESIPCYTQITIKKTTANSLYKNDGWGVVIERTYPPTGG